MTPKDPILVLGRTGLLGGTLLRELDRRGRASEAPGRGDLDLCNEAGVERFIERRDLGGVINAAAFTDVVRAEQPEARDEVDALNRRLPASLGKVCARRGIPVLHVSTDYVFDGAAREPYREDDPVKPLQVYGRSKLDGERALLEACPQATVVRTSTLFGPGRRERPHYVDAIVARARVLPRLELTRLPVSSPTYALDLAEALLVLHDVAATGVVHVVNRGACSRIDLAREALRICGLDVEIIERPEPSGEPHRPAYSVLDVTRYEALTGRSPRAWQEALAAYLGAEPSRTA